MTQVTPPTWSRVKAILGDALELPTDQREAFLDRACAGESALRRRVSSLISAYTATGALADTDSPARSLPEQAREGSELGRYRIKRLIARGGMGAVYEAVDEQLGRPVAIKLLQTGVASEAMVRRFELEPRLLARLRHPGIAQIFEASTVTGEGGQPIPFFAMELVIGAMPITTYADSQNLSVPDRLRLFIRVCDAVMHGHQRSVLHRDLKPANILVDCAGNPKIIDFGVGRAADPGGAATTVAGELLGTVRYMSPEQVAGDPDDIDVRADVYALGVVLYELLSGHAPHPDSKGGVLASIRDAQSRTPLPLSRLAPDLSGDIETVGLKAVAQDRQARYQSVVEFAGDLQRILNHEPISARPQSAIYHLRLFARRNRALVAGAAAIVAALTLGVIGTSIGLVRATNAERTATAQSRRAARIANFLENTLRSADPGLLSPEAVAALDPRVHPYETWVTPPSAWGSAGPSEVGAAGLLRHAAKHLEAEFADDPLLQADAAVLLATTLASLEDVATASELVERALALQARLLPPDDDRVIRSRYLHATFMGGRGRPDEADRELRTTLELAQRRFGPLDGRTRLISAEIAVNLAHNQGRIDDAVAWTRARIDAVGAARGPDSPEAWLHHVQLIELLFRKATVGTPSPEVTAELVAECRAAIDGLSRTIGPDAAPVARAASCLASIIQSSADGLAEAESLQRRALAIYERSYGRDSRIAYDGRTSLMTSLLRLGRLDEGAALAREALDSSLRMIGPRSAYTLKAKARLARILTWQERNAEEAERLARDASEGCDRDYGPTENFASYHQAIWAAALRQRHAPDRAESMIRERIALRGTRSPQTDSAWVEAYQYLQLALCLADQNRPAEAVEAIRTAAIWGEQLGDAGHPILLNIRQVQPRLDPAPR